MNLPQLIKAGDTKLLLGQSKTPPKVDCRVWSEDSYQEIISILKDVRDADIRTYIDGDSPLLPQKLRSKIYYLLKTNSD